MTPTLTLEIVTPETTLLTEDVESVGLPAADGDIGILPQHVRLITQLVPGEVRVTRAGTESLFAVGEGLVDVGPTHVSIITDMAVRAEDIDEVAVTEARERAAARLRDKISDEEIASVNASLVRAVAQLHVKRRVRSR